MSEAVEAEALHNRLESSMYKKRKSDILSSVGKGGCKVRVRRPHPRRRNALNKMSLVSSNSNRFFPSRGSVPIEPLVIFGLRY